MFNLGSGLVGRLHRPVDIPHCVVAALKPASTLAVHEYGLERVMADIDAYD
jgi:hypothetical protein